MMSARAGAVRFWCRMTEIVFSAWPKIARFSKEQMTVTEKIDGSNACVILLPDNDAPFGFVYGAQSRSKLITPESDNFGFAKWVYSHADELWADLGPGYHFGEWWGSGIQRGYGLEKGQKNFSLFNAVRWNQAFDEGHSFKTPQLGVVPLLYHGPANLAHADVLAQDLYVTGSQAAPGFRNPEGVVVYLREAKTAYKITDSVPGDKHFGGSE